MFNDGRYWQRAKAGELREVIVRDGHPSAPKANEPFCTRSQTIIYLDRDGRRKPGRDGVVYEARE